MEYRQVIKRIINAVNRGGSRRWGPRSCSKNSSRSLFDSLKLISTEKEEAAVAEQLDPPVAVKLFGHKKTDCSYPHELANAIPRYVIIFF